MNIELEYFARSSLKRSMASLSSEQQRVFKLMYARDNGRRSIEDAVAMHIDDVVDGIPSNQLDWAMQQVSNTVRQGT